MNTVSQSDKLKVLRDYLDGESPGEITDKDSLESLLYDCWNDLIVPGDRGMAADKLIGRIEDIDWNPPRLSFVVERHGGTMMGSVYAELQGWMVNLDNRTAVPSTVGKRLVGNRAKPVKAEPDVERVLAVISENRQDPCVKWKGDSRFRVVIGEFYPQGSAVAETLRGRRKRFAIKLEKELLNRGWRRVTGTSPHTYERLYL